jgi:hypothetical protein
VRSDTENEQDLGSGEIIRKFVDFVRAQDQGVDLTYDDVAHSKTRAELGISSLSMLILVANYIEANGNRVALTPDWVPMLDDVEGILAVFSQIDRDSLAD